MKYVQLVKAINAASQHLLGRAAIVVNHALVVRNWLVGAYIVEFEQHGEDRAKYGQKLMPSLAGDLQKRGLHGLSLSNLKSFRQFFQAYPQIGQTLSGFSLRGPSGKKSQTLSGFFKTNALSAQIRQTLSDELCLLPAPRRAFESRPQTGITPLSAELLLQFSWSKILELIRIDDPLKCAFYENECLKGNWSVRQLQRQIGSLLFERTGLSTDKAAVLKRARRQETQETIEDLIRDPYILEFAGLAAIPKYTETELEAALLDHLQKFLIELGVGFCFEI